MSSKLRKSQIITLYKHLLREAKKFPDYNFRAYAVRRVKDGFKENKVLTDAAAIRKEYDYGLNNLDIIRRQIIVGDLYKTDKLVIEKRN